jgi:hypothetical protein
VADLPARWEHCAEERQKLATEYRQSGGIEDAIALENARNAYERCASELREALARERPNT